MNFKIYRFSNLININFANKFELIFIKCNKINFKRKWKLKNYQNKRAIKQTIKKIKI